MEKELFEKIRSQYCQEHSGVTVGKMMSSDAMLYNNNVFAFFSRKNKMVFKLGKSFDPVEQSFEVNVFNPFKKRGPLNGWFEVPITEKDQWWTLTETALELIKQETK
ncbi:MAG: hypothetical protein RJQ14_21340 [Marinoscillum sp.]